MLPRRKLRGNGSVGIVGLVAIRQMDDLLHVERLLVERQNGLVSKDIVVEIRSKRAWKTEVINLDWRRPGSKNCRP